MISSISPEYRAVVNSRNILRARIMLKDSMVVEPTFSQFDEMLSFARRVIPEIIVPFDGEVLEPDSSQWTRELMNMELVQIINNFSEERIAHLKKVIGVVLADEIRRNKAVSTARPSNGMSNGMRNTYYSSSIKSSEEKKQERRQALGMITSAGNGIGIVMDRVKSKNGMWSPTDVADMEEATKRMMSGIRKYKDNK